MLKELMENAVDYDQLWEELGDAAELVESLLNEGVDVDVQAALDEVIKQMEAAKRGLGIVNKLEPGEYRRKHASRVMSNMNQIRARMRQIQKAVDMQNNPQADHLAI